MPVAKKHRRMRIAEAYACRLLVSLCSRKIPTTYCFEAYKYPRKPEWGGSCRFLDAFARRQASQPQRIAQDTNSTLKPAQVCGSRSLSSV